MPEAPLLVPEVGSCGGREGEGAEEVHRGADVGSGGPSQEPLSAGTEADRSRWVEGAWLVREDGAVVLWRSRSWSQDGPSGPRDDPKHRRQPPPGTRECDAKLAASHTEDGWREA